jgi:hypothetical protein
VGAFQEEFPATMLRFDIESSAVIEPVLDGRCAIGVVGSWALVPPQITHEALLTVRVHIQISHIDPCDMTRVLGATRAKYPKAWRLSHLGAKLAFLRAGFGFGGMPLHMIQAELASGALVEITPEDAPPGGHVIEMGAIYRTDGPPGPAGRWFIERLKQAQTPPLKRDFTRPQPVAAAAKAARPRSPRHLLASKRRRSR